MIRWLQNRWPFMQDRAAGRGHAARDPMNALLAAVAAGALPAALEAALQGQAEAVAVAGRWGVRDAQDLCSLQVKLRAADAAIATIQGLQSLPDGSACTAQAQVRYGGRVPPDPLAPQRRLGLRRLPGCACHSTQHTASHATPTHGSLAPECVVEPP